jgi:hypothetical protein
MRYGILTSQSLAQKQILSFGFSMIYSSLAAKVSIVMCPQNGEKTSDIPLWYGVATLPSQLSLPDPNKINEMKKNEKQLFREILRKKYFLKGIE